MRFLMRAISCLIVVFVCGCASSRFGDYRPDPKKATARPYVIKGVTYCPQSHYEYDACGVASFYGDGDGFHGKKTSTGETYDAHALTAAHKTLPLPCVVEVINLENGKRIKLKVNDRGPFIKGRIIDVSTAAARELGFHQKGLANVRVRTLVDETKQITTKKSGQAKRTPPVLRHAVHRTDTARSEPIIMRTPVQPRAVTLHKPAYIAYGYARPRLPAVKPTIQAPRPGYEICVARFQDKKSAITCQQKIAKAYPKSRITLSQSASDKWIRVKITLSGNVQDAKTQLEKLKKAGYKGCYILK